MSIIVKVVPPQMLSSSSGGATVHPVPIAFSPVNLYQLFTMLGLEPVSIVHYTRHGSSIKLPTQN